MIVFCGHRDTAARCAETELASGVQADARRSIRQTHAAVERTSAAKPTLYLAQADATEAI